MRVKSSDLRQSHSLHTAFFIFKKETNNILLGYYLDFDFGIKPCYYSIIAMIDFICFND